MAQKIKILERPIYVYLIGLLYLVFKISLTPFSIDPLVVIMYLCIFGTLTFLLLFFLEKILRYKYVTVLVATGWVILFFHSYLVSIAEFFIRPPRIVYFNLLWISVFFCGVLLSLTSLKFVKYNAVFNKGTNVFLVICIGVILSNTIFNVYVTKKAVSNYNKKAERFIRNSQTHKDIVWILMDAYESSQGLKANFGFNNPLDSDLQGRGFHLLPNIESRFDNTLGSIASILNFDDTTHAYSFDHGFYIIKNNALTSVLTASGYDFYGLDFFSIGKSRGSKLVNYYTHSLLWKLVEGSGFQTFMSLYMKQSYNVLFAEGEYAYGSRKSYNQTTISQLEDDLQSRHKIPTFTWAHLMIPHPPYYKLQNGKLIGLQQRNPQERNDSYIQYLSYGNMKITEILDKSPIYKDKIVIITGDHGSGLNDRNKEKPYCAIFIPSGVDTTGISQIKFISQIPGFILDKN